MGMSLDFWLRVQALANIDVAACRTVLAFHLSYVNPMRESFLTALLSRDETRFARAAQQVTRDLAPIRDRTLEELRCT